MYRTELAMARKRKRDEWQTDMLARAKGYRAYDAAAAFTVFRAGATHSNVRDVVNTLVGFALWKLGLPPGEIAAAYDVDEATLRGLQLVDVMRSQQERDEIEAQIAIEVPETPESIGDEQHGKELYHGVGGHVRPSWAPRP